HEVSYERRDVLGPLAQRWQLDRKDVQPIVEIVAESVLLNHPEQVPVGRSDYAHVHLDRPRAPEALEFLLLQDPQELRLELEGNLADLVEEERPPVGNFEPADLLPDRPGEGAPLVTEELALEETRGDRRAIQLDERPPSSRAEVVNLTRDELLPGTCLSLDQDDGVGRRNDLGLLEHPAQRTARPHD